MNNQRRKLISDLAEKLSAILEDLASVKDDEQEAYDNMPESLQGSERGEQSQAAIDYLEEAYSSLDGCIDALNNVE